MGAVTAGMICGDGSVVAVAAPPAKKNKPKSMSCLLCRPFLNLYRANSFESNLVDQRHTVPSNEVGTSAVSRGTLYRGRGGGLSFASVSKDCSNLFKCHVVPISSVPVEFEEERIASNFLFY